MLKKKTEIGLLPQKKLKKKVSNLDSDPCNNHRMRIYSEHAYIHPSNAAHRISLTQ